MNRICFLALFFLAGCNSDNVVPDEKTTQTNEVTTSETQLSPVDYNNEITFMQDGIFNQVTDLFHSDSASVDENFENTMMELDLNQERLESMDTPEGGEALKNVMIEFFDFYRNALQGDFQEILVLLKKSNWTNLEADQVAAYDAQFAADEKEMFDRVTAIQVEFANHHKIRLQEF